MNTPADQALWLASRATGLVTLSLLSATIMLGVATTRRYASAGWPRSTVLALHRNLSLLAVVFLTTHVATAVIDPYASIRWIDAVVPLASTYRPFWLGLGSVALDGMVAVLASSMLRRHIPSRLWRTIHWAGYAVFPIAVIHALGVAGSDASRRWVLVWLACCTLAVTAVCGWRIAGPSHPDTHARKTSPLGRWS